MIPPSFDYVAPRNLGEAVDFLEKQGDDAKILAGGHSLIPLLRFRFANPKYLVDINHISGLEYIHESDGYLHIGSLTRYVDVETSQLIQSKYPALLDAAGHIADPLVRNLGTVGGNVCHSDPANDLPAVMLALGASMIAVGRGGERVITAEEFFVDTFQTALKSTELLKEILVPIPSAQTGNAYLKLERGAGIFPVVGVAAQVRLDEQSSCEAVGLGLTAAAPKALKPKRAEAFLQGKRLSEKEIQEAASLAAQDARPISDIRGPAEYKREIIQVLAVRALQRALERARGGA